ncbi:MAG: 50S ribosomal protein L16 [Promethearchaeota archaeon]
MGKRPWACYRKWDRPPYQKKRSRSHRKEYVRGGADPKIRMYDTGNRKKSAEEWELSIGLKSKNKVQISHFALEAIRASINRRLQKYIGRQNYHIRIRPHPWHVFRENKMMAFAGADRLQSGMRNSFGRCIGRCARVRANQTIVEVFCSFKHKDQVIKALKIASYKLPCKTKLVVLRVNNKEYVKKIGLPLDLERPIPE